MIDVLGRDGYEKFLQAKNARGKRGSSESSVDEWFKTIGSDKQTKLLEKFQDIGEKHREFSFNMNEAEPVLEKTKDGKEFVEAAKKIQEEVSNDPDGTIKETAGIIASVVSLISGIFNVLVGLFVQHPFLMTGLTIWFLVSGKQRRPSGKYFF